MTNFSVLRLSAVAAAILATTACSMTPAIDTSPTAEVTFDGLHEVTGVRVDKAWARPGFDITGYSKIKLQGAGIEFRPGGESGRTYLSRTNADHFEVTPEQRERFQALVTRAFLQELAKSESFEIVNDPGPDVLLVRGGLIDVVSFVPPEPVGRSDIYLSAVGEATLVLEIRDSITNAILVRVVDRDAAEDIGGGFSESNRVNNAAEVRRLVNRWARALRERLDQYAGSEAQ